MLSSCAAPTGCSSPLRLLLVCYMPLAVPGVFGQKRIDYSESAAKKASITSVLMSTVKVSTTFGQITLKLRPDAAPKTVEHLPVHNSKCRGAIPPN